MPINNFEFNLGSKASGNFTEGLGSTLKSIRTVQGMTAKNSVTALTKDLILQYPVIIDSDIETETAMIVAKAFERQYAALQLALWSADTAFGVDTTTANGTRDFVKRYHSNNDSPDKVQYLGNLVRNINQFRVTESAENIESAEIVDVKETDKKFTAEAITSTWETLEGALNMDSLNDKYLPNTAYINEVNAIASAIEAGTSGTNPPKKRVQERINAVKGHSPVVDTFDPSAAGEDSYKRRGLSNAALLENKRFSNSEPTMLEVSFFVRDDKGSHVRSAIIGIKAMMRSVATSAMKSNLIKALQSTHGAFQFVKWTRGEAKIVKDFIFNVSSIKEDAINRNSYDKWFSAMRKRKRNANAYKGGNVTINPLTTIVISAATAQAIKETAGYDLYDVTIAQKLINALYLLGFCIVDQSTGVVTTLFDDFGDFTETTIKSLQSSNKSGDVEYSQLKDVLKLMGRV